MSFKYEIIWSNNVQKLNLDPKFKLSIIKRLGLFSFSARNLNYNLT